MRTFPPVLVVQIPAVAESALQGPLFCVLCSVKTSKEKQQKARTWGRGGSNPTRARSLGNETDSSASSPASTTCSSLQNSSAYILDH